MPKLSEAILREQIMSSCLINMPVKGDTPVVSQKWSALFY